MSKQIKVSDEVHQRLMGAKSDTETVSDLIARLLDDSGRLYATTAPIDEADALVEQLDKQEWQVDPLIKDLGPDELPECCQTIYDDPTSHCEHWEDRRPVGYWNKLTHKWANDPDYIQYV